MGILSKGSRKILEKGAKKAAKVKNAPHKGKGRPSKKTMKERDEAAKKEKDIASKKLAKAEATKEKKVNIDSPISNKIKKGEKYSGSINSILARLKKLDDLEKSGKRTIDMFNKGLADKQSRVTKKGTFIKKSESKNINFLKDNIGRFIKKATKRKITKVPVNQNTVSKAFKAIEDEKESLSENLKNLREIRDKLDLPAGTKSVMFKKGGLIKRKNGGPIKPRGVGAALRGFKMKGRK